MQHIKELLKEINHRNIKEQLSLLEIYQSLVEKEVFEKTRQLFIKNKILYMEVSSPVLANKLHYKKAIFLKTITQKIPGIKEIRVIVGNNAGEEQNGDDEHQCRKCGSKLLPKSNSLCSLCLCREEEKTKSKARKILQKTPWIQFEDVKAIETIHPIPKRLFMDEKRYEISQLYDIISQCYREIKLNKNKNNKNIFIEKVNRYIILKLCVRPEKITSDMVKNHLPSRIHKVYCEMNNE
ncbi:MAG: DciA family protein [Candidatus Margulisbacteria bacterium]|nr:DciA family protein [Candidatus Margulisiibacteriota bacterium]